MTSFAPNILLVAYGRREVTFWISLRDKKCRVMRRSLLLVGSLFMWSAGVTLTPVVAEINCGAAKCQTCSSVDECKALETSGRCNGPITCGAPGEPCTCVVSFKGMNANSLKQKKPLGKSQ
jgi:hypothetical protein